MNSKHTAAPWFPTVEYGPSSHVCWTPDAPGSAKTPMVLITHADFLRVCDELSALRKFRAEVVRVTGSTA